MWWRTAVSRLPAVADDEDQHRAQSAAQPAPDRGDEHQRRDRVADEVQQVRVQRQRRDRPPPGAVRDQVGRRGAGREPGRTALARAGDEKHRRGTRSRTSARAGSSPDRARAAAARARPRRRSRPAPRSAAAASPAWMTSANWPSRSSTRCSIDAAASTSAQSPACVGDAVVRNTWSTALAYATPTTLDGTA